MSTNNISYEKSIGRLLALLWEDNIQSTLPPYAGAWQRDFGRALDQHNKIAFKAPRQTGKSTVIKALAISQLLLGNNVILASPTLQQTSRILLQDIHKSMSQFKKLGVEPVKKEGHYTEYNTGGKLVGLSLSGDAAIEGYTSGLLIIDEAQNCSVETYEKLLPSISQSIRDGSFKIVVTGIGSVNPNSLLAQSYSRLNFHLLHITPEYVLECDPSYAVVFNEFKETLTNQAYRLNIDVEDLDVGSHQLYPFIEPFVAYNKAAKNLQPEIYVGIDVGRHSDETVVIVIQKKWDEMNIIGCLKLPSEPFHIQASKIHDFLLKNDDIQGKIVRCCIESNGLGVGLYDRLQEINANGEPYLRYLYPVHIDYKKKSRAVHMVQDAFEKKKLGCNLDVVTKELKMLTQSFTGLNEEKAEYTHSDIHSALLMAILAING